MCGTHSTFPTPILFCNSEPQVDVLILGPTYCAAVKLHLEKKNLLLRSVEPATRQVGVLPLHYMTFHVEGMKFFYL
jgi:hypothetical protein